MKTLKYWILLLTGIIVFTACQKEYSVENGFISGNAAGSLKSTAGDCQPIFVHGQFVKDSTLSDSSYIDVQVNFSQPGLFKIYTDTINGFSFGETGYMLNTGLQNVRLYAAGSPDAAMETNFTVYFDTSYCMFSVNVTDSAIPNRNAVYALTGTSCSSAMVNGTYTQGTALDASNTVSMQVNVTSTGNYNISTTPTNGITFTGQGIFTGTGDQTVVLRGSGTPTTAGSNSIPITAGTSCSFTVNVATAGTGGGGGGGNNSTNTGWFFNQGSLSFNGDTADADLNPNPISAGSILSIVGPTAATGDSVLTIFVILPGNTIEPGSYATDQNKALFSLNFSSGDPIYSSNNGTPNAVTTVVITSYDATTKIVTGTFSGNVENQDGTKVLPITNGTFSAVVQ